MNFKQIKLLLEVTGANNIILAYDKEFKDFNSKEANEYFNKLKSIGEKYKNYCNFSFIFDFNNLLKEKESPIDSGRDIFEKLMKERVGEIGRASCRERV